MKGAIIFYSFSGNTKKACLYLAGKLKQKGHSIEFLELRLKKEVKAFLRQSLDALCKKKPELVEINLNLDSYDFLIFSSPVWAFTFAPALRTYLSKASGLEGKKAYCFLTYGSGTGCDKAQRELIQTLGGLGAKPITGQNLAGHTTKYENYLDAGFKGLLDKINP